MANLKFTNPGIKTLLQYYQKIWALTSAQSLAGWDLNTYMPSKASTERGVMQSQLEVLTKQFILDPQVARLIKEAKKQKLNAAEKGVLHMFERLSEKYSKLPDEFLHEFLQTVSKAQIAWAEAKNDDDYKKFAPYLQKIVDLSRRKADLIGYDEHPYDALLDDFEEGLTAKQVTEFFKGIKPELTDIYNKVLKSRNADQGKKLQELHYHEDAMRDFNYHLLKYFNADWSRFRLDVSSHPFTQQISSNDVRITTRYHKTDFARSMLATIHEFGHALYELQIADQFAMTPLGTASSLVIHESQSRFWENYIGRSEALIALFYEQIKNLSPEIYSYLLETGPGEVYKYLNRVNPGPLRVEADELTYHFHIMLRFDLELGMIEGKYKVSELNELWREKIHEYLKIKIGNDTEGVLQDIHWSMGAIGYFPTYSMGTFMSGIVRRKLEQKLGALDKLVANPAGIVKLQGWLKQNIHQYGAMYTYKGLLKNSFKTKYDIKPNLDYLKQKYSKLYH